jgi:DNA-directed RNA polymerase subunit RPC12/RpoP
MRKRLTFQCWNCGKTYTLLREITTEQTLTVACPYCNAEAVVDLEPFRKKVKNVMRSGEGIASAAPRNDMPEELDLPDVLPTKKKPE